MNEISISSIEGFKVGHATNFEAATGCTVILSESGSTAGLDVRGGAPGTRETDLLKSENLVDKVHAVFLSGGSAFGLDAGTGIMRYLEEQNIGFDVQVAKVPIVPGAVLFDLHVGNSSIRPNDQMGYDACVDAKKSTSVLEGNVGAGTGATVGKCLGPDFSMKAGLGTYAIQVGDLKIGAVVAVNCFGDVVNTENKIIAGLYDRQRKSFMDTQQQMLSQMNSKTNRFSGNTTIGAVITNAKVTKAEANKISSMAHDGIARVTRPSHTMVDGDTLFTMATGDVEVNLNTLGFLAALVVENAIIHGVEQAATAYGFPSYKSIDDK